MLVWYNNLSRKVIAVKTVESKKLILHWDTTQKSHEGLREISKVIEVALPILENFVQKELKVYQSGVSLLELQMTLCGGAKIKSLNRDYRQKDKITDVLSFPVHDTLREFDGWMGPLNIGDLFICREVAKKQAKEFKITYAQEVIHLLVHGFLHLLGYDHELGGNEEKLMFDHEEKLVAKIYKKLF